MKPDEIRRILGADDPVSEPPDMVEIVVVLLGLIAIISYTVMTT